MWERRSMTSTRLSSSVATRSATVRPKKPEPTTTRSGLPVVTAGDCTDASPSSRHRLWFPARPEALARVARVDDVEPARPLRVVAVTYSPGATLDGFLESLATATVRPVDVVLADNGSTDGAPERAAATYPHVRVLPTG